MGQNYWAILCLLPVVACRHSADQIYAATEGRATALPPIVAAGRVMDPALAAAKAARLVGVVESAGGFEVSRIEVRVSHMTTGVSRADTTDSLGRVILDGLAPGDYVGTAKRVGLREQSFRVHLTAGYADTLRLTFAWAR